MGSRVRIIRMSNGNAFHLHQVYRVVMHSYRAHGGGELLTKGAGISFSESSGARVTVSCSLFFGVD